ISSGVPLIAHATLEDGVVGSLTLKQPQRRLFDHRAWQRRRTAAHDCESGDYSSGRPVIAASSRVTRSDTWPVTGSFRSRSNFSIAALVSALTVPVGLIWP